MGMIAQCHTIRKREIMGKQINFFMLNSDERIFFDYIKEQGDSIIDINLNPIDSNSINGNVIYTDIPLDSPPLLQFFIISTDSIIKKYKNKYLDTISSDVIEFSRGSLQIIGNETILSPGRIWAELKYYNDQNKIIGKDKWFQDRTKNYINWIKKNFKSNIEKHYFIGSNTIQETCDNKYKLMDGPKFEVKF